MMKDVLIKSSYLLMVGLFGFKCFNNVSEGLKSKQQYLSFKKEKKQPRVIRSFNQIENVPISLDDYKIKYGIKKPNKKVVVPKIDKLIEPDKIAEPVQLPEPVVIDTPKFKSKIKVSKE